MESLPFFKSHKPKTSKKQHNTTPSPTTMIINNKEADLEDGDDSFFELELTTTLPPNDTPKYPLTPSKFVPKKSTNSDPIPKRKVLPIEPICKPNSPISLLKSAPKLSALTFRKSRSTVERQEGRLTCSEEKSKWGKYLKVIRSFYVIKKVTVFSGEVSVLGSPLTVDPRKDTHGVRNWLGRSKSTSVAAAAAGIGSPAVVGRRDDSLALHYDGIQSAILHCKNSFNSSKDCSYMSRYSQVNQSMHPKD